MRFSSLCTRLEGIPLAIELAAAWATALTPAQMLERLTRRFDLLVSRRRDRNARHLTLRAALDYSYELLPPILKRFFRQITVFRGGMSLETAEEVTGTVDALEMLTQLQQRSLILAEESGAAMRFRLLDTLREYGWDRLTAEEQSDLSHIHTATFVRFADSVRDKLNGSDSVLWMRALEAEQENLRTALERLFSAKDFLTALRVCGTLWRYWYRHGYLEEALRVLERALATTKVSAPSLLRADALEGTGRIATALGRHSVAIACFEEQLAILRPLGRTGFIGNYAA